MLFFISFNKLNPNLNTDFPKLLKSDINLKFELDFPSKLSNDIKNSFNSSSVSSAMPYFYPL